MKKYILTLTLLIIAIGASAQTISYGVKAGINLANIGRSDTYDKHLTGFNIGAILDLGLDGMSIQPGLFYTVKGDHDFEKVIPGSSGGVSPTKDSPIHYLEMPVNIFFDIKIGKPLKMQLGGGPYFAYSPSKTSYQQYMQYNRTDIGANLIAGFVISNKFILDVQYGIGISDAVQGGGSNRVSSFSVGYLFK